jgi:hypothetical protein
MGALTALDVSNNELGEIVLVDGITHCKATSGKMMYWDKDDKSLGEKRPPGCGPLGVVAIANAIKDMGAMTSFTFGDTQVITMTTDMTEANFSGKLGSYEVQLVAAFLPKCTYVPRVLTYRYRLLISPTGNRAMTSLNLASNYLDADGAKIIAEAIKVIKCAIAVVLAPFSYSSDQWLNCCCLLLSAEYGGPIAAVVEGQQACHPRRWKGIGPSFGEQLHPQGVGCIQQYLEGWKRPLAG